MSISRLHLVFFLIVLGVAGFLALVFLYNESIFWSVLPEFIAGFLSGILGIILGFEIDRRHESSQQQKRTDFTLRSLRDEIQLNWGRIDALQALIERGEECFVLFNTTTWKKFGNQLDSFKDFRFVLSLGYHYWELDHLNEAMKKGSTAIELKNFYAYYPPFNGIDALLDSLKKSAIAFQQYIDKYFFEK